MRTIQIPIFCIPGNEDLPFPTYQSAQSAGVDLHAAVKSPTVLSPMCPILIPCGFAIAIPKGYEAQIRRRSGLVLQHRITVANAPGTIDSDYRGEIGVILINLGSDDFVVQRGMRIAQLVVAPIVQVSWQQTQILPSTPRASGGLGHTGL